VKEFSRQCNQPWTNLISQIEIPQSCCLYKNWIKLSQVQHLPYISINWLAMYKIKEIVHTCKTEGRKGYLECLCCSLARFCHKWPAKPHKASPPLSTAQPGLFHSASGVTHSMQNKWRHFKNGGVLKSTLSTHSPEKLNVVSTFT
jgi:hypothetical protein